MIYQQSPDSVTALHTYK